MSNALGRHRLRAHRVLAPVSSLPPFVCRLGARSLAVRLNTGTHKKNRRSFLRRFLDQALIWIDQALGMLAFHHTQ